MAIVEACARTPTPVATAPPSSVVVPSATPVSSSAPSAAEDAGAIGVIAKILTPSGPAGDWDPTRLWLLSYDEREGAIDLVCGMRDAEDVSQFLRRLTKAPTFTNVTIVSATKDGPDLQAEIKANVPPNGYLRITPKTKGGINFGAGNRDPFEPLLASISLSNTPEIATELDLDQLTLVATMNDEAPRAMFTDPTGKGWIVKVGDDIARTDGSSACTWRVTEVKPSQVLVDRVEASICGKKPSQRVFRLVEKKH